MYTDTRYEIGRTGKLRQYYTLYQFIRISAAHFAKQSRVFVKNLSFELDSAISEAEKIAGSFPLDVYDSEREIIEEFHAFDLDWKKGKNCYYARPSKEFWAEWKEKKCILKENGFYVTKSEKYGFTVFFKGNKNDRRRD
jgi:hypothetical protein